jgi:glycerol-3-phosphate acyltransferase PlsY
LKGKGGKGVATSIGVLLIYAPKTCIVTIIIWLMTVLVSRYSSLGALAAFGCMPFAMAALDTKEKIPVAAVMSAMLFIRHKDNIARLLKGTEGRIGKQ